MCAEGVQTETFLKVRQQPVKPTRGTGTEDQPVPSLRAVDLSMPMGFDGRIGAL